MSFPLQVENPEISAEKLRPLHPIYREQDFRYNRDHYDRHPSDYFHNYWYEVIVSEDTDGGRVMDAYRHPIDEEPNTEGLEITVVSGAISEARLAHQEGVLIEKNRAIKTLVQIYDYLGINADTPDADNDHYRVSMLPMALLESRVETIRADTGFAVPIRQFNGRMYGAVDMVSAYTAGEALASDDPRMRFHDIEAHYVAWLLLTESAISKLGQEVSRLVSALQELRPGQITEHIKAENALGRKLGEIEGFINAQNLFAKAGKAAEGDQHAFDEISSQLTNLLNISDEDAHEETIEIVSRTKRIADFAASAKE